MSTNPWQVDSIQEFTFLNCPECVFYTKQEKYFEDHAIEKHPLSSVFFGINAKGEEDLKQINFAGVPVELIEVNYDEISAEIQQNIIMQDDLKNSDVFISTGNFSENSDHFQGFQINQIVSPKEDELKVSSVHDEIKPQQCLICGESFTTQKQLKEHSTLVHDEVKPYPCSICGNCFSRSKLLNQHVSVVHEGNKLFQCSLCNFKSGLQGNMRHHINRMHEGLDIQIMYLGEKKYNCTICNFSVGLNSELYRHIREIHNGKQNWQCVTCKVSFKNKVLLRGHEKSRRHKIKKANKLASVQLKTKGELRKPFHKRKVTKIDQNYDLKNTLDSTEPEKPHQCLSCEKVFTTQNQLNYHKSLVHITPYPCSICGKCFTFENLLKTHISVVHEGQKLFQCSLCDFKSGRREGIVGHIDRVHEGLDIEIIYLGENKYNCTICDFSVGLKSKLYKHIREIHDGKQNYHCLICKVSFKNKVLLRAHLKTRRHKIKKANKLASAQLKETQLKSKKNIKKSVHKTKASTIDQNDDSKNIFENDDPKIIFENDDSKDMFVNDDSKNILFENDDSKNVSFKNDDSKNILLENNDSNNILNFKEPKKAYQCLSCEKVFPKQNQLSYHTSSVHLKPHPCSICGKCFTNEYRLKEHILTVHERQKKFQCSICDYKSGLKGNMRIHINRVHNGMDIEIIYLGDKNNKCNSCDFETGLKRALSKHIREVHDGKQNWYCDICTMSFTNKTNLRVHEGKKRHAIKKSNLLASVDGKANVNRKSYKIDQAAEDKENSEPCTNFKEDFFESKKTPQNDNGFSKNLNKKVKTYKNIYEKASESETNQEVFQEYNVDVINQKFVPDNFSKSKIIASAKCNTSFKAIGRKSEESSQPSETNFNDIFDTNDTHLIPKVELHNCQVCNHSFGTKSSLNTHAAEIHEIKKPLEGKRSYRPDFPLECKICDAKFSRNDKLKEHITAVHEKKKPFQCSGCDYQSSLKMHMSKHLQTVHKNESCEVIYLGEKDQKCTLCDFSSALKGDLDKHIREAHDFKMQDYLKTHVESVHERKKQQFEQSPKITLKEETKVNNDSDQDFSSDEFNVDHDPLEVNFPVEMKSIDCQPPVHERKKPYKCTFCSVSFLTTENVKEHISIVHEGKKWTL